MGPRTSASLFVGCLLLGCSGQNQDEPASEQGGSLLVQVAGQADPADGLPKPMSAETAAAYADVVDRFGATLMFEPGSLDHVIGFQFETYNRTRADMAVLKSFSDLQELHLIRGDDRIPGVSRITDAHLEHLEGLTNLRSLSLSNTQVSGGGLAHLLRLTKLKYLSLNKTNVQDPGLLYVARFKQLESLRLNQTKITDAGLAHLTTLTSLEYLSLYGTGVTDAGLVHLKALKSLKKLFLLDTKVTEAGRQELAKALPNLEFLSYE